VDLSGEEFAFHFIVFDPDIAVVTLGRVCLSDHGVDADDGVAELKYVGQAVLEGVIAIVGHLTKIALMFFQCHPLFNPVNFRFLKLINLSLVSCIIHRE